ncbi:hypothetical protein [Ensifer soli]|uniref:hypothetical protein n=1 Tax=Ciceribacter sp. sgz301302 TaxID=3342379 RepID=UPI0035B85B8F
MAIVRTVEYSDVSSLLDELNNQSSMLKALSTMLECSMRDRINFFPELISEGVYMILERNCAMLDFVSTSIGDELNGMRAAKLKVLDIDTVAAACGVPYLVALSVVSFATGIPQRYLEAKGEPA